MIVTLDKDLYQLVDTDPDPEHIEGRSDRRSRESSVELFGVTPEQIPDLLACGATPPTTFPGRPASAKKALAT